MEKYRKEREEGREKYLLESSTLLVRLHLKYREGEREVRAHGSDVQRYFVCFIYLSIYSLIYSTNTPQVPM